MTAIGFQGEIIMNIQFLHSTETTVYAAEELKKYLERMDAGLSVKLCAAEEICAAEDTITLGLLSDLSLPCDDVADSFIDDVIDIDVSNMSGYIAGSNERSILMGVYDFLKSAGCMWVRPGGQGEFIPQKAMGAHSFRYRKKADYAFRGQCIEGAVSFENVRDTVLWLPKVNMNLFMMEQIIPYNYMSRWYKHSVSTVKEDEGISFEQVGEYVVQLEKTIKKCGLQLHALGHGYLLEPYGIHYKTAADKYVLSDEAKEDVALVNGKRELFHGSPNFTQLCFSKDRARLGLVKFLTEYLEKKPYIDFLHVWLSDAVNNHCECENCRKKIPSDFYVQMLNELDAELTKRGIQTKIVFIMYTDTLWAPETTKLINQDRFIMTTAPTRDYNKTYCADRYKGELPPFKRNDYYIAPDFSLTLSFMDQWQDAFSGRRFLFEYHFYTDHFFDPGHMSIARGVLRDIQNLDKIEFDGIMSDQTQRSYFPTGLPLSVLGEGLFDKSLDFDSFADRYFAAAYGTEGNAVRSYLEQLTAAFDPEQLRLPDSAVLQDTGTGSEKVANSVRNNPEAEKRLSGIPAIVDSFADTVEKNLNAADSCHRASWKLLQHHGEYCKRLSGIFGSVAAGNMEQARTLFAEMIDYLSHIEDEIQPEFDLVLFNQRIGQFLKS